MKIINRKDLHKVYEQWFIDRYGYEFHNSNIIHLVALRALKISFFEGIELNNDPITYGEWLKAFKRQ